MCGITGIFGNLREENLSKAVSEMTKTLSHRGPDDKGIWIDAANKIALGHRRLSIIDLSSAGHQPMASPCGRFNVIFNGEIYNHLKLRKLLNSQNNTHHWSGHSDTETLVTAFSQWGVEKTLDQLVGMFAVAVWDAQEKELTLIRDRLGEKPLYYGWSDGVFLFGSELKALRKYKGFNNQIDRNVLSLYMQYMYVPNPYSIFENVYKLEPGCILKMDMTALNQPPKEIPFAPFESQGLSIMQWYALSDVAKNGQKDLVKDENEAVELLEKTLTEAVQSQLITDVPLGAFLSGGVDSSVIVSLMQKLSSSPVKTFTIGFEESAFNEAIYAKEVSRHLGTEHHELYVTSSDAFKVIPYLPTLYDEPFADSSQIPTYLVSKLARESVTVSLSGDAGDELFGGYNRYLWSEKIWSKVKLMPVSVRIFIAWGMTSISPKIWNKILSQIVFLPLPGDKIHKLASLLPASSAEDFYFHLVSNWYDVSNIVLGSKGRLAPVEREGLMQELGSIEQNMMYLDSISYLPDDILVKVDRAAMGVSLETRIPFLNHQVVEFAYQLPLSMKINAGQSKWILRQVLDKYIPRVMMERPKMGFAVPIDIWLRGPLRDWAESLLNESRLREEGFFNPELIREKWGEHLSGSRNWHHHLWSVLMFQSWLENQ